MNTRNTCRVLPTKVQWSCFIAILFAGIVLRSFGWFQRASLSFPIQGDGIAIAVHSIGMKTLLLQGKFRLFAESFFEYYMRPSVYLFNMAGAFFSDMQGQYVAYLIYSIISLIVLFLFSLKYFDEYTALGTVFLGVFSTTHINYSMKMLSSIPCFMMIALSLYFFMESHYGNKQERDKILCGLSIGIAFTCHNSAGLFPFVYIVTELYIYVTDKRNGWFRRFILLLVTMAFPLLFWEGICYFLIKSGGITSPTFKHYFWRLLSNESLTLYTADISPSYVLSIFLHIESVFFLVLIFVSLMGVFYGGCFRVERKHKTFFLMAFIFVIFSCSFPKLCANLRQLFPFYVFILPIGGLGLGIIYKELKKFNKVFSYCIVSLLLVLFIHKGYAAAQAISEQQKLPFKIFSFLKEAKISKLVLYSAWSSLPYIRAERPWPEVSTVSDKTGYTITMYNPLTPERAIPLAREKNIRYFLANYYDYELRPGWKRHFMFSLHDKGVKKPVVLWRPEPDYFPATYFDEIPHKLQRYDMLYAKRKIPVPSRDIAYCTMLYDLSMVTN